MKPILFSTPMVQAILDGRKTMTRRVMTPQPLYGDFYGPEEYTETIIDKQGHEQPGEDVFGIWHEEGDWGIKCKYRPGDILWVRETWAKISDWSDVCPETGMFDGYIYKADWPSSGEHPKWRPSIFMPRDAARIFLRVTNVRVERVQDISTSDCEEEGLISDIDRFKGQMKPHHDWIVGEFEKLWNSINAKRGYGWDTSPFVWVISFERCEKPEAADA